MTGVSANCDNADERSHPDLSDACADHPTWAEHAVACQAEDYPIQRTKLEDITDFKAQFWKRDKPVIISGMHSQLGQAPCLPETR